MSAKDASDVSRLRVLGVCISVQLVFSGWHVLGGVALSGSKAVDPYVFALYREVGASILMALAAFFSEGYKRTMAPGRWFIFFRSSSSSTTIKMNRKMASLFILAGLTSFGNVFLTVMALTMIPSDLYSMYQPIIPVITTAIAVSTGFETKLNRAICAGIAISVVGAVMVEYSAAEGGSGTGSFFGNILTLVQCVSISSLIVITKPLTKIHSPLTITVWYYTIGSLWTLLALLCAQRPLASFFWSAPEPWAALVYAIVVATFYAYEAYSWLVHNASPTLVAAFCPLQPVFTVLLNFLILAKGIGLNTTLAGCVVIFGLLFTIYGKRTDILDYSSMNVQPSTSGEETPTLRARLLASQYTTTQGNTTPNPSHQNPAIDTSIEEEEQLNPSSLESAQSAENSTAAPIPGE